MAEQKEQEPRSEEEQVAGAGDQAEDAGEQVAEDLDELTATKRERDEYLELAQRTRADFENYRKRVAKEAADALARGKGEFARELIPVVDNLERALAEVNRHAEAGPGRASGTEGAAKSGVSEEAAFDALKKGVALVHEELRGKLQGAGVEAYDPVGEEFDPELHEALSTRSEEGTDSGRVLETVEKGYRLNGRVLRPARVVVSE